MAISDLFFFLLIALFASSTAADGIHGCGGFVEASSSLIKSRKASDTKLDYSHITVELCTVDGLVKDRTLCAPNGYYFIPVYDKGSFIVRVKGPDGWSFEPDTVPVIIDQNGCNANADINFRFTGFMISGRVKGAVGGESCSLKDGGPSGVAVELLSLSDDVIASVLTSATGDYSFTNIIPGKYKLHASHPNLEIEVRGSPEVNLGFGNIVVDDIFFVLGYDLDGFVVAQGNPILGVHLYLYSDDVLTVHCPQGVGTAPREKNALCHAISDADGKFTFRSIPCGIYELLPYYKGENTTFDVSPPSMSVSIEHHHVTIPQKFQVTGFSVGGRVVDGYGAGVDNATVIVDGKLRAITDSQGYYMLDQVTSKHYSIGAEKAHYKFNTLENFLVMPNMVSIDDIKAVRYDICGAVQMITANSKAMVTLTHGPDNGKPQKKLIDENGNFCFEVPAGDYRLSAFGADSASSSGLMFSPPYVDVKVNRPLLNVEFVQALVDIHGTVLCKENCNQNVSISLVRLVDAGMQERRTIALTHESGDFMFQKVFPGRYRLEVKHISSSSMPEEDNWCWDRSAIDLDVGTEDVTGIVFVQKGYWISIISTHDTDAYIQRSDSSRVDLSIRRGSQKICVESPGQHELHFVNSCIFFGSSSLTFDTLNPVRIYLTGKKYLLKGEIHMDLALNPDAVDLSEHIVVDILNRDGVFLDTISTKFASDINDQRTVAVYEYSIWSDLGEEFIFVPRDSRTSIDKKILFYPRQRLVSVAIDGCQAPIPPVVGQVGLYLVGSVSPALSGVNVRILAAGESSYAPLQKGDLAFETETGPDGSFTAGPLYNDTTYNIEASKPGYHVRKVGSNSFTCQKLGQIVVNIFDGAGAGELLPSVLLSLSGEDGYRNNSVSGAGGTFVFDNLFPGSFYLRPLLKEYAFSPAAVAIELDSGESKVIKFYATRVAYSAMGSVSLLSGQPKEGVYVEARSESKGYYEEATTDSLGNFRLRGLLPDTTYLVKVVAKDYLGVTAVERASPDSVVIKVASEDIRGLDFVVFEQPEITILSGHVEGSDLEVLQPHLSVEVRFSADPSKIETVFPLPLSYFFQIRDLPKGKHLVQLRSGLPSSTHKFESDVFEVDLEKQPQIHVGPLRFKVEEYHHKQELTPAPVFPLIVGLSVIALFISMPRLKDLYQMAVGTTPTGSGTVSSKKEARKPLLRKRVY
ncbi:nodal modulator 1 [Phoenix dactylifera]|uniref:Nodal modulator 1 n=1 Tax=Phoenix dactylifera TaxID=42345 RepID=A0A8B9A8T5_PHODC|nr:nodal modulator 1 [Phoenix dactylifera]